MRLRQPADRLHGCDQDDWLVEEVFQNEHQTVQDLEDRSFVVGPVHERFCPVQQLSVRFLVSVVVEEVMDYRTYDRWAIAKTYCWAIAVSR